MNKDNEKGFTVCVCAFLPLCGQKCEAAQGDFEKLWYIMKPRISKYKDLRGNFTTAVWFSMQAVTYKFTE